MVGLGPSGRVIIWDFEGTLAVRAGRFTGALVQAARRCDPAFAVTDDAVRPLLGGAFPWHGATLRHGFAGDADAWWASLQGFSAQALQRLGMDADRAAAAVALARSVYLDPAGWTCLAGATDTLDALSARGWTHVLMSNFAPELDGIVEALGLADRLAMVFSSGRVGLEKPNRAYFDHVLAEIAPARAAVMIGDNPQADVAGGRSVGLKTILIGGSDPAADFTVERLADIPALPMLAGGPFWDRTATEGTREETHHA